MSADNIRERLLKRLSHYRGFVFRWQPLETTFSGLGPRSLSRCSTRFAEHPQDWQGPVLTEEWVTPWRTKTDLKKEAEMIAQFREAGSKLVPSPKPRGFQLDWICPECFETCREELGFVVDSDHRSVEGRVTVAQECAVPSGLGSFLYLTRHFRAGLSHYAPSGLGRH